MTFNENDVNRDLGGRFDNKVGSTATIELTAHASREEATRRAHELLDQNGLTAKGWTFKFDRAVTRAGMCNYKTRTISLSGPLLEARSAQETEQTLLHEVAHALTPGHGHGRGWLNTARELGYTGKTTASSNEKIQQLHRAKAEKKTVGYAPSGAPIYGGDTFTDPHGNQRRVVGIRRSSALTERVDGSDHTIYDLDYLEELIPGAKDRPKNEIQRASKSYPSTGLTITYGDQFTTHSGMNLTAIKMATKNVILRADNGQKYQYSAYGVSRLRRVLQSASSSA